ncbi:toprim domain-containing protein [Candidatus Bathyarchaeota archaeon]|nr:toprim domain-containing protein [Candidatus Bathyarchaeota archaeon]
MATYERILERLSKVLERLGNKAASGVPIIVEGKKDVKALSKLGIIGEMIQVKGSGKVLEDCLDLAYSNEVVIFVDFDKHGTELAKEISKIMESRGVKADLIIWRGVQALVRKDIKDVEGLPSYLERLKKKLQS